MDHAAIIFVLVANFILGFRAAHLARTTPELKARAEYMDYFDYVIYGLFFFPIMRYQKALVDAQQAEST